MHEPRTWRRLGRIAVAIRGLRDVVTVAVRYFGDHLPDVGIILDE